MLPIALALMSVGDPASPSERLRWISPMDYPAALAPSRAQGTTEIRLTFNPDGRVTGCEVMKSSGTAGLDAATCSLSQRRGRAMTGEPRIQVLRHRWTPPAAR